jgi:transposase
MAMSKRSGGEKQEDIWIAHRELAVAPGHLFYKRLNELLEGAGLDEFVEGLCARFYHARLGRPSLRPGVYFRALLVGYFEGIDSERGIAWRIRQPCGDFCSSDSTSEPRTTRRSRGPGA